MGKSRVVCRTVSDSALRRRAFYLTKVAMGYQADRETRPRGVELLTVTDLATGLTEGPLPEVPLPLTAPDAGATLEDSRNPAMVTASGG